VFLIHSGKQAVITKIQNFHAVKSV